MKKATQTKDSIKDNTFDFTFCHFIPYTEKEELAQKLVLGTVICDPEGIGYISYRYELIRMFLIVQYYTNIDTSDWDTEDGRANIFDYMTQYGDDYRNRYEKMCEDEEFKADIGIVDEIFSRMASSIIMKHEHTSTLSYRIGVTFGSILGNNDIIKTQAESREVNESLIQLIEKAVKFDKTGRSNIETSSSAPAPGMISFAKK